jgi:nicotinamidase-related amidase
MPLTTLDTSAALIAIDLQKGIVGMATAHPASDIVSRSAQLASAFRKSNLPVILVNVTAAPPGRTDEGPRNYAFPDGWADLAPELDQQPSDHLVTKKCVSAFVGTGLHELLQQHNVTQIFLTGIATSAGVAFTAGNARDLGYNVVIVTDAVTDRDADTHNFYVSKVFPRLGETDTTANVLKALAK